MNRPDFHPEESEFLREMEPTLARNRSLAGPCPPTDLLMAAVSGVPLEDAGAVLEHAARCPICAQLSRDLAAHELPGVSDAEDRRIRARWEPRRAPRPTASVWNWLWRPLPAAVVFATLAALVAIAVRKSPSVIQPVSPVETARGPSVSPTPAPAPSAFALVLQKAAIKIPAAAVLIYRSDRKDSQAFLKDLAAALEPYRRDDYAEAARLLAPLTGKYPDAAEPAFYLGVSQLFLNQNESAIASLQMAGRRAGETLRDDASWYLALALERAGKPDDARREAEALCIRAGEYKDKACAAAHELGKVEPKPR
jgi:hypothetical protein